MEIVVMYVFLNSGLKHVGQLIYKAQMEFYSLIILTNLNKREKLKNGG